MKKLLFLALLGIFGFGVCLSLDLLSDKGNQLGFVFGSAYAQDEMLEESGPGKTDWYYYDCEYVQGKYCSSVPSDLSCGRAKKKPSGAC